ncbi:MAG: hypothetical protein RBT63_00445 [Bdellovibrionales bacterium]|jgi:peptidoglycan L-alanyl-D-glutamate endopeptidase CwlK|nr:hypothetical protein [Bdellovibrionales bacterium]
MNFSQRSKANLATCHEDLQRLFCEVVVKYDCTILEGHRGEAEQNAAFDRGDSKLQWPDGKHNKAPSLAVDVAPYPIDWKDLKRFAHFAGYVQATADRLGIKIRWGGDWNGDRNLTNDRFLDMVHFELVGPK